MKLNTQVGLKISIEIPITTNKGTWFDLWTNFCTYLAYFAFQRQLVSKWRRLPLEKYMYFSWSCMALKNSPRSRNIELYHVCQTANVIDVVCAKYIVLLSSFLQNLVFLAFPPRIWIFLKDREALFCTVVAKKIYTPTT